MPRTDPDGHARFAICGRSADTAAGPCAGEPRCVTPVRIDAEAHERRRAGVGWCGPARPAVGQSRGTAGDPSGVQSPPRPPPGKENAMQSFALREGYVNESEAHLRKAKGAQVNTESVCEEKDRPHGHPTR